MIVTELFEFRIYQDEWDCWNIERKQQIDLWYSRKPKMRWIHFSESFDRLVVLKDAKKWLIIKQKSLKPREYVYFSESTIDNLISEAKAEAKLK